MAASNECAIQCLNGLIETCKDGEKGFQAAAERVQDADLKQLCQNYAQQRARFVADLQIAVRRLGGDPETSGSLAGKLHRGWMSMKSAVTGSSDEALIAEAERGEDVAKATYEKALESDLPLDVQAVVERQYIQVKEAHDRIRSLERQLDLAERKV